MHTDAYQATVLQLGIPARRCGKLFLWLSGTFHGLFEKFRTRGISRRDAVGNASKKQPGAIGQSGTSTQIV